MSVSSLSKVIQSYRTCLRQNRNGRRMDRHIREGAGDRLSSRLQKFWILLIPSANFLPVQQRKEKARSPRSAPFLQRRLFAFFSKPARLADGLGLRSVRRDNHDSPRLLRCKSIGSPVLLLSNQSSVSSFGKQIVNKRRLRLHL